MTEQQVTALERALALCEQPRRGAATPDGYADLMGPGPEPRGLAQAVMTSRTLPKIYERWWRPAWSWLAKGGPAGPSLADEYRIVRERLALAPGQTVLDLACGPGNVSRAVGRAVGPSGLVVGVDTAANMLAEAARDTAEPQVAYVRADATALPFRDRCCDAVSCCAGLNLFADPMAALDQMVRVLAPGGRLLIFTSCQPVGGRSAAVQRVLHGASGIWLFGRTELTDALRARGLSGVGQRVCGVTQFVWGRLPGPAA